MIIEKIEIENFLCYFGKVEMEFKEGINVIIGDNAFGKSKLYDAFHWVLFDQIFASESKKFKTTKEVKSHIISDKAKFDTPNGKVQACVAITFYKDATSPKYILERRYTVNIANGVVKENNDSEFTMLKRDQAYMNARVVNEPDEINRIINRILPDNIKDYLWFQGEQVESMIDFTKPDTLDKAINALSDITRYDQIQSIATAAARSGTIEYDKEIKRYSKDVKRADELSLQKEELVKKLAELKEDELEIRTNFVKADAKCQELLGKIEDVGKIRELQTNKANTLTALSQLQSDREQEQIRFYRKMFRNKWVLKGTEHFKADFATQYDSYLQQKLKIEANKRVLKEEKDEILKQMTFGLPIDVPEPIHLKNMLAQEKCLVCHRDAPKGSPEYKRIEAHLHRSEAKPDLSDQAYKNDFSAELRKLYNNSLELGKIIQTVDEDINDTLTGTQTLTQRIQEKQEALSKVDQEIEKLLLLTSLDIKGANSIMDTYTVQLKNSSDFQEKLNRKEQEIQRCNSSIEHIDSQLAELITGEIPEHIKIKRDTLKDFETIATSTRERVFNTLITRLETEANVHYTEMTKGNKATKGLIRLHKKSNHYMPEIVNSNGSVLAGLNTSNLILVKLASIMAIVSAKSHSGTAYSLITDAPTSVFGEDYTIGFCKAISKVYKQSIVMSKEFYHNARLRDELINNPDINVGKIYTITPSILENDRDDRNSLVTTITALK
jgi:DNA sulfur modification protein DndD